MRRVVISGRIANFGRVFRGAEGDKGAFAVAFVNVSMDRKDEATGYTETKPMKVIGSNWVAERLNNFEANDPIYLEGRLEVENDYTNSEGELVKGGWIVRIDSIDNWGTKQASTTGGSKATPPKAGAPKKGPAAPASKKVGTGIKMPSRAKKAGA